MVRIVFIPCSVLCFHASSDPCWFPIMACGSSGLRLKKLDKKAEKALLSTYRKVLKNMKLHQYTSWVQPSPSIPACLS